MSGSAAPPPGALGGGVVSSNGESSSKSGETKKCPVVRQLADADLERMGVLLKKTYSPDKETGKMDRLIEENATLRKQLADAQQELTAKDTLLQQASAQMQTMQQRLTQQREAQQQRDGIISTKLQQLKLAIDEQQAQMMEAAEAVAQMEMEAGNEELTSDLSK